jgi:hypothetical protein
MKKDDQMKSNLQLRFKHMTSKILLQAVMTVVAAGAVILQNAKAEAGVLFLNGDGIVEQNIFFAYNSVPKAIENCIAVSEACGLSVSDIVVLQKIKAVAEAYKATPERIIFTSDSVRPGFFETGLGQAHRVAATTNSPGAAIYFNSAQFYSSDGTPALDLPLLVSILVHELGHQTGVADHAYLDFLGGRLRGMLSAGSLSLPYPYGLQNLKIIGINYINAGLPSDIYFVDSLRSSSMTSILGKVARCPLATDRLIGWNLQNAHWDQAFNPAFQGPLVILGVSGYVGSQCVGLGGELTQSVQSFRLNVYVENNAGVFQYVFAKLIDSKPVDL